MSRRCLWEDTTKYWEDKYDNVISRLRKVVEEINKYEEPLYDVHWDTGYEDGKNEAIKIIRSAFPELEEVRNE